MAFNLGNSLAGLTVRIGADLSPFRRQMRSLGSEIQPLNAKFKSIGSRLGAALGASVLGASAASIKAAIDFESAFAGVRKTIDATEGEFGELRKGIVKMSKVLPSTAIEISGVAEAAGQLGIAKDNVLAFSRVMIDLGETTNLSANEAATSLARFANITQMSQGDFGRLGSAIVDLGNNFATTEREISDMALRLAGAGNQVGLSQSDILGFAAALSSVGVEAEAGGTAFSKLFAQISGAVSRGGSQLAGFARVAGTSAAEYAAAFRNDAARATTAFIEGLGRIANSGGDVLQTLDSLEIAEIRMRDAILRTAGAGDILTRSLKTSNDAWKTNNALVKEAEKRYGTAGAKLQIAKNEINAAAVEAGSHLAPAFVDLAQAVGQVSSAFADLTSTMQKFTIASAGLTGVAVVAATGVAALGGAATAAIAAVGFLGAGFTALLATGLDINTFLYVYGTRLAVAIKGTDDLARAVDKIDFRGAIETGKALEELTQLGFTRNIGQNLKPLAQDLERAGEEAAGAARKLGEFVAQANGFKGLSVQGLDLSDFTRTVQELDLQTGKFSERVELAAGNFGDLGEKLRSVQMDAEMLGAKASLAMEGISTATLKARLAAAELGTAMKDAVMGGIVNGVNRLSDVIGGLIFNVSTFKRGLSDAEVALQRLGFTEQASSLGEQFREGHISAQQYRLELKVLDEKQREFESSINRVKVAFKSFGEAVGRIMAKVVADISAAIAKMLILRGLAFVGGLIPVGALGGWGGFFGSALGSLGGGNYAMANFSTPAAKPAAFQTPIVTAGSGVGRTQRHVVELYAQGSTLRGVLEISDDQMRRGGYSL